MCSVRGPWGGGEGHGAVDKERKRHCVMICVAMNKRIYSFHSKFRPSLVLHVRCISRNSDEKNLLQQRQVVFRETWNVHSALQAVQRLAPNNA